MNLSNDPHDVVGGRELGNDQLAQRLGKRKLFAILGFEEEERNPTNQ
jgi:hypothetical protein